MNPKPWLFIVTAATCIATNLGESQEASTVESAQEAVALEQAPRLLPIAALEAFVDGYMASYLEEAHVAGATVAILEGDETVFAKGYGYSDLGKRSPVHPEKSLFRIGSISKLFVWTSVMQLVEQGQLDLDADVNEYLENIEIPEGFGVPVTMAQLMTHSAGFDERILGLFADDAGALRPLGDILREELPERVRPPAEVISYSNHGTGLAMLVVEQVSGLPWEVYIEEKILEPLELRSTSFAQPLPDDLSSQMSKGYKYTGGEFVEAPFEFVPLAPVGAAASSAADMARFMAAHLKLGALGETRILGEDTARLMQTTLFRHHPNLNGMAHGFMEMEVNGQRIIGHGGDTELFHSLLAFFPEQDIGLFVSFNTVGANYFRFLEAFVEWRFPLPESLTAMAETVSGLGRFAGSYRPTRYPHHSVAKISALVSTFEVLAEEDHLVTTGSEKRRWFPVEPLLFREQSSSATLGFRETEDGQVSHLFLSEVPVIAFERAPASEMPSTVRPILGLCFLVAVGVVLFWPLAAFLRWHYGVVLSSDRRISALGRWSAWLGSLAVVGFTLGLAIVFSEPMRLVYGLSPSAESIFWLPPLALVFIVVAFLVALRSWPKKRGSFPARASFTLAVVAVGLFLWQLQVWNLLGFNY